MPADHVEGGAIDDDDEDAVARIGGELEPASSASRGSRRSASGVQVSKVMYSEALDRLRLAVLEDLEVVLRQSFDDPAVFRRGIGVDADVVRAGAEDRRPLGLRLLLDGGRLQDRDG